MIIDLYQTCGACPEQYDAYWEGKQVGYLRLRHGFFTVDVPDAGPDSSEILCAKPRGDGLFDPDERDGYLQAAAEAIAHELGFFKDVTWREIYAAPVMPR